MIDKMKAPTEKYQNCANQSCATNIIFEFDHKNSHLSIEAPSSEPTELPASSPEADFYSGPALSTAIAQTESIMLSALKNNSTHLRNTTATVDLKTAFIFQIA